MSAYLEKHLPHLVSLHAQLALGPDALEQDQTRIEEAIRNAVEDLLRQREQEVDGWKDAIAAQKRRVSSLARALGDRGRNVVDLNRRESLEHETLPRQMERLQQQSDELEVVYAERVKHIQTQRAILDQLAALLGPPIESAPPLAPLPLPTLVAPSVIPHVGPRLSQGEDLFDVAEHITTQLDAKVKAALEERASRLADLEQALADLCALHVELALPPIPLTQPHHFPIHLLPSRSTEEQPGSNARYEKLLSRFMSDADVVEEPEQGLIIWVAQVKNLWENEQQAREARIQTLYDQIEPLWGRLQLDQDQMELFMQMNLGCSEAAIKAYEAELERCLELRQSSLSSFITGARAEIETLWTELMMSEEENDFAGFIDDVYTEELLCSHETYAEELRAEVTSKATLLPRVREWHQLVNEEDELERAQNDPDRYKRRGGAMLREERLRKRVTKLKPMVEDEMMRMIPAWEEANGRPFMVQGERVVDKIQDALAAKEAAKETKKLARLGLAPRPPLQPARMVRATPVPSSTRKRAAPAPTPSLSKRPRMVPPSGATSVASTIRPRVASAPRPDMYTPTPCGLPRPVPRAVSNPAQLAKADGRRPRRESFRPRQSLMRGVPLLRAEAPPFDDFGLREEDEDVFE